MLKSLHSLKNGYIFVPTNKLKHKTMKDNTSKKKFNRNSITVNVDSKYSVNAFNKFVYDAKQTELIHDALQVLLNSPNPLSSEYGFTDRDFIGLSELRKKQTGLIRETKEFLSMCKTIKEEIIEDKEASLNSKDKVSQHTPKIKKNLY